MRFNPFLLTLIAIFCPYSISAGQITPPNVIVILVDDQGYYDLGCYGATEVKTPNIDAMANDGILFTDYYAAAPICSAFAAVIKKCVVIFMALYERGPFAIRVPSTIQR